MRWAGDKYPKQHLILSPALHCYDVHFLKNIPPHGRTVPHLIDPEQCEGCLAGVKADRYCFLGGWCLEGRCRVILRLTARGVAMCPSLRESNGDLRGQILHWTYLKGPAKRGGSLCRYILHPPQPGLQVPEDFHVPFHLLRLWGLLDDLSEWMNSGNLPPWKAQPVPSIAPSFPKEPPL